ncbi:pro-resilin-like [Cherax quadricarinatus]|nr:pro-resilin-like [Cherax quadricarinatus]
MAAVVAVSAVPEGGYGGPGSSGAIGQSGQAGGQGSGGQGSGQGGQAQYAPSPFRGQGGGGGDYGYAPASYNFQWDVNDSPSGNFYGHGEERDGDNTQGSYYVQLPDGRKMVVNYVVDQFGYNPTVTFEGEAQFPSGTGQGTGSQQGYYQ